MFISCLLFEEQRSHCASLCPKNNVKIFLDFKMTSITIMVLVLLVVTSSASIDVFPEVDNYISHNHPSHAIDLIANSPLLRILLNN